MRMRNKGGGNLAIAIATVAIVLFVTTIILGSLFNTGTSTLSSNTAALATFNNVSNYVWTSTTLMAIGVIVLAGMGVVAMIGGGRR